MFCDCTLVLCEVRVPCPVWLFSVVPWFPPSPVCCAGIFLMVLKWFHLPLLLLVLRLFLHSTCFALVLWGLNILESSRLFSWTHFCYGCRIVSTFGTMRVVRSSPLRTGRPPSPPGSSWYSVLEAESTPGHMELSKLPEKSPVKPPGIDPGTHRLVAQHLNHYATPHTPTYIYIHTYIHIHICTYINVHT